MKTLKKLISAAVAVTTALTVFAVNVSATGYKDNGNANAALTKPKLTMDKIVLTQSNAAGKQVTVNLKVSGAQLAYCSTGIHVYWDSRLKLAEDSTFNLPKIDAGDAIKRLGSGTPTSDPNASKYGMNGYFLCTAGSANSGTNGVMWSFTFILPKNAKIGDVYPIDIIYKSNNYARDLFINKECDTNGYNMQAYTFKKGIYSSDNPTFTATAADILKVPALANINKTYDGYIAVCSDNLLLGDANCDGRVTIADSVAISQSLGNPNYALSAQGKDNADCCDRGDGVNANDAKAIRMIESGYITANDFPIKSSDLK